MSPARLPITMETLSTPSHTILSPGLLSPAMLSPASISPASLSSASLSPHLLSPGPTSLSLSEPGIHIISPPLSPVQRNPRLMHLRSESGTRQPLMKQYSMDMGSDSQLHQQHHSSVPNVWEKFEEEKAKSQLQRPKNLQGISQSQPTLADLLPKADSLDSDPGHKTPRLRLKQRLLRSRSSGAKYSRFKDKYKREKFGEDNPTTQPMIDWGLRRSKERLRSSQCGSGETGSDMEDSLISNWADEEAACDEEVKMITGEAAEDEDDVHPTLVSTTSSDLEDPANTSHSSSNAVPDSLNSSLDCEVLSHSSSHPVANMSHSHVQNLGQGPISPLAKSPLPSLHRAGSRKARHHLPDPGIDNSSFELGEEMQTPKCDSLGSESGTPGSLKGRSPGSAITPVALAQGGGDSASPASVRQVTPCGSLPSPATSQPRLLTPGGATLHSPVPGHLHIQSLAVAANPGPFLQLPVSGGGLASPQSPVPRAVQERLMGSPPIRRLHVCSTSPHPRGPHPHPLSVDCDSSTVPDSHFSHPLSSSPIPPSPLAQADNSGTVDASSSSTALPSSSSSIPPAPSSMQPLTNVDAGPPPPARESFLVPVVTHPLQLSPIPPLPSGAGLSPMHSPSYPGGSSKESPKVRHRTLSSRQSSDRELPDNSAGPVWKQYAHVILLFKCFNLRARLFVTVAQEETFRECPTNVGSFSSRSIRTGTSDWPCLKKLIGFSYIVLYKANGKWNIISCALLCRKNAKQTMVSFHLFIFLLFFWCVFVRVPAVFWGI